MKIDHIEMYHVSVPLKIPLRAAWTPGLSQTHMRFTLLRLMTDTGIQGLSAGIAGGMERQGLGPSLAWYLGGIDPTDLTLVHQRLTEASLFGWRNFWAEAACWDIAGKAQAKPVYQLLGGRDVRKAQVYASTAEMHSPEQRAEEVVALYDQGFKTVKLRVHSFDPAEDVRLVAAVRHAVGDRMSIGVDANQGWRRTVAAAGPIWDLERATEFALACADLGVRWLEEPLDMHEYDQQVELSRRSSVPIAGGETNDGWHELKTMIEKGCYTIYQPDAMFGGGVTDAWRTLLATRARSLGFTPHTWTNGIGFLVNLHVYAAGDLAWPLEYPYEPPAWAPEIRDALLVDPICVMDDGAVAVPQTPGLGIILDEDQLAHYGEKFFEWSQTKT